MSVLHMEGWSRFAKETFPMCGSTSPQRGSTVLFADTTYTARGSFNTTVLTTAAWNVNAADNNMRFINQVTEPTKTALSGPILYNATTGGIMSLERAWGRTVTKLYFGFMVRVPLRSNTSAGPYSLFQISNNTWTKNTIPQTATLDALRPLDTEEQIVAIYVPSATGPAELRSRTSVIASIARDRDYYVEVEVDTVLKTTRIWLDDLLVQDRSGADVKLAQGMSWSWGFLTTNIALLSNILISDIYVLDATDGVTPTGRLGSTTRVQGISPAADVDVDFTRPVGQSSNAGVVSLPISGNPDTATVFLTGANIGDTDIYTAPSSLPDNAALVHGVKVHARYRNTTNEQIGMAVLIGDGTTMEEKVIDTVGLQSVFTMRNNIFTKNPAGASWSPADFINLQVGFRIKGV